MRDLSHVKKAVVKIGTHLLSSEDGINLNMVERVASEVSNLRNRGVQVLLVSSGAVGLGAKKLMHKNPVRHIPLRQAFAAIGNPILMNAYSEAFKKHNLLVAQLLITRNVLNNRSSFKNLQSAVATLLALGVVPIFNENDVVSTNEIGNVFGDNDRLSAYIASKTDADLLVLLTDIDGLYDGDPNKGARLVSEVEDLDEAMKWARGTKGEFSTGGMKSKLQAAKIAQNGGCITVISSGWEDGFLTRILDGEDVGTYIAPLKRKSQRMRWILNAYAEGSLIVDEGAERALLNGHKSLLPSGIVEIEGEFQRGDVVEVKTGGKAFMKGVTSYSSSELEKIKGHKKSEIASILGLDKKGVVFRPEDAVIIEESGE